MGRRTAFFGSQKKKSCHLNDRCLLKPTLDGKKAFPASLFLQVSNWVNDATENDKTHFQQGLKAFKDRAGVLEIIFQNIFIDLIENKVSCINKHTIYTSIT